MAGNLSSAMLAECQKVTPSLAAVVKAELPSGTVYWSKAETPISSSTLGHCEGVLISAGQCAIEGDFRTYSVASAPTRSLTVADLDGTLSKADANGERLGGSIITTYLASPNVAYADWLELHSGELSPALGWQDFRCRLTVGPNAGWLNKRIGWPITEADWACDVKYAGVLAPICIGLWDASAGIERGAVSPARISTTEYVFAGWLTSVDRVFVNTTLKVEGGGAAQYQIDHPTNGAKQWTRITFGTAPAADDDVQCDVHGLEGEGDGTGSMVKDPAASIAFVLANFVYDQNPGFAWDDGTNAPINMTSVASLTAIHATAINGAPAVASRLYGGGEIGSGPTGWQELESFGSTWAVAAYFGWDGKLSLASRDSLGSAYVESPLVSARDALEASRYARKTATGDGRRFTVNYGNDATGQESSITVEDATGDRDGAEEVNMDWGPGSAR